jgi:phytoene desaturase
LIWDLAGTGCQMFWSFFADFGKKTTDYYELIKLSPAYRVYFGVEFIAIADNLPEIEATFEKNEKGSGVITCFWRRRNYNYNQRSSLPSEFHHLS